MPAMPIVPAMTPPTATPATPVIDARNLHVTYASPRGPVTALAGLDWSLPAGALFVLLGPNGAGKTSLMRCATGLVKPSQGEIRVFGRPPPGQGGSPRSDLGRLGVLIENPGVYARLDARDYLAFFGSFYAVSDVQARIDALAGELQLELDGKPVAKLSQGNRQKLHLVRSLLHRPELLLWDEPTDHLDPVAQKAVLQYLRRYLAESGAAALVATHRLEQMESVATHFGFLNRGRLQRSGTRGEILSEGQSRGRARVGFASAPDKQLLAETAARLGIFIDAQPAPGPEDPVRPEEAAAAELRGESLEARMPDILAAMVTSGFRICSVELQRAGLAEIYERWVDA